MCIFAQPVVSVDTTQIFARTTGRSTQYLVYQMSYQSNHENAMILPIPVRRPDHEGSVRFLDLSEYEKFFADLADGFPYIPPSFSIACSAPDHKVADLRVFKVGNYVASFVPTVSDFSRLDEQFTLPDETWSQIPEYADFGFVVFQLAEGFFKPHPMAFEFETQSDSVFFPTLHIHDGEIHETESFDHSLYLQHAGLDSQVHGYRNRNTADQSTGLIRSQKTARHFSDINAAKGIVAADLLVHMTVIQGHHQNRDTKFSVPGHPRNPSINFRTWLVYSPWFVLLGGLTWFFARRNRIKRETRAATQADDQA